jgi:hypothetical protein
MSLDIVYPTDMGMGFETFLEALRLLFVLFIRREVRYSGAHNKRMLTYARNKRMLTYADVC